MHEDAADLNIDKYKLQNDDGSITICKLAPEEVVVDIHQDVTKDYVKSPQPRPRPGATVSDLGVVLGALYSVA